MAEISCRNLVCKAGGHGYREQFPHVHRREHMLKHLATSSTASKLASMHTGLPSLYSNCTSATPKMPGRASGSLIGQCHTLHILQCLQTHIWRLLLLSVVGQLC